MTKITSAPLIDESRCPTVIVSLIVSCVPKEGIDKGHTVPWRHCRELVEHEPQTLHLEHWWLLRGISAITLPEPITHRQVAIFWVCVEEPGQYIYADVVHLRADPLSIRYRSRSLRVEI
jgi:hypothetical protein